MARPAGGSGPLPPTLFLWAIVVEVAVRFAAPRWLLPAMPWRVVGIAVLSVGATLTVFADRQFTRARTEIHPFGRPSVLVTSGAFRWSRNPMYVGLVAALVGIALILRAPLALAVPAVFAWLIGVRFIRREERTMAERFGAEYEAYARRVQRWL